jgi:nucleotide-binding universal stress UspA family protein
MFKSLLVPLDGSAFGEHALPLALSLARRANASIQLVHVQVPQVYSEGLAALSGVLDERARKEAQDYLDGLARRIAAVSSVPLTPVLLTGTIAEAIHDQAVRTAASLVVLTTHGRGPLSRFWLGSVADELLRRLPMPVLLVRPEEKPAVLDRERVIRRLLIPLRRTDRGPGGGAGPPFGS